MHFPLSNDVRNGACASSGDVNLHVSQTDEVFSGVLAKEYQTICSAGRTRRIARNEILHVSGDPVRHIIMLTTGLVKVSQLGMSGSESIIRVISPGDLLGLVELFSTKRHSTTAQAVRPARALVWHADTFMALSERQPALLQNLVRIAGGHLEELSARFCEVANERVSSRVARQVVRLTEKVGRSSGELVEITLSREDVARMTGTTLFTVSRLFSAWAALGLVKTRREGLTIVDMNSLRTMFDEG
jgi:CRP-like cAMP-binding protein